MSRFFALRDASQTRAWGVRALGAGLLLLIPAALAYPPRQQFANLGSLRLDSGKTIPNATIGYRTMGRLNESGTNAVLVAPWYQGTSGQVARQVGRGKLVDSSRYFVIIVDPLGNGVSSSPSTSDDQRDAAFPAFTIHDIVESQHQLVTRALGLTRLHAVVGISMGGMQVLQWTIDHPLFMKKAVAIVGTPQSQPDDRQRWADGLEWWGRPRMQRTRQMLAEWKPRTALDEFRLEPYDRIRQAQAIMGHDIALGFDGSLARAVNAIRAELMIVTTRGDREVNPGPAFELAQLAKARLLELDGRCGHQAPSCERHVMWPAIDEFLSH